MTNRNGDNVSTWSTPYFISNNSVSPSGDVIFTNVSLYVRAIVWIIFFGIPYASRICSIVALFMMSNAILKSTKMMITLIRA